MSKQKIKLKDLGLFLVVEDKDSGEEKLVFYRAYFTKEDIINALENDKEFKELVKELKPVDLVIATLTDSYNIKGEDK